LIINTAGSTEEEDKIIGAITALRKIEDDATFAHPQNRAR